MKRRIHEYEKTGLTALGKLADTVWKELHDLSETGMNYGDSSYGLITHLFSSDSPTDHDGPESSHYTIVDFLTFHPYYENPETGESVELEPVDMEGPMGFVIHLFDVEGSVEIQITEDESRLLRSWDIEMSSDPREVAQDILDELNVEIAGFDMRYPWEQALEDAGIEIPEEDVQESSIADHLIAEEMKQGQLFDLGPYTEPDREPPRIKTSYDIVTPESAEEGDVADSGWLDEEGVEMESWDEDETYVDAAVEWLENHGAMQYSGGGRGWYSTEPSQDYHTGESETQYFHLEGFTPEEEKEIYQRLKSKRVVY